MRKFYLSIIVLCSFVAAARCQTINAAEYFFDTDPGQGRGTPITVSSADTVSLKNIAVNSTSLSNGYHYLYVRVRNNNGKWGHYRRQRFYVFDNSPVTPVRNVVVKAEYWIDTAAVPGTGKIITLNPKDTVLYYDSIPGLRLDTGLHIISLRVKDSEGKWSLIKTDSIRISAVVVPITVSAFQANCVQNIVTINWVIAGAQPDIKYFTVQKSTDSTSWVAAGNSIPANNQPPQTLYNFSDVYNKLDYYRLQVTGKDDKNTYTPAVKINCRDFTDTIYIYPVPTNKILHIAIRSHRSVQLDMLLIDMLGRTIGRIQYNILFGTNNFILNTQALPGGQYVLRIINPLYFKNQKFIIAR